MNLWRIIFKRLLIAFSPISQFTHESQIFSSFGNFLKLRLDKEGSNSNLIMAEDMTELEQRERNERCSMRVHRVLTSKNELVRLKDIDSDWNAWVSPVFKGITFEVISTRHHEFTEAWKASSTYQACYKLLNEVMVRQEKLKITACMCLGLGSFTGIQPISGYDFRKAALSQLVAFEGWGDQLRMPWVE